MTAAFFDQFLREHLLPRDPLLALQNVALLHGDCLSG